MNQYRAAAEILIARHGRAMTAKELVDRAIEERIFSDSISGKTPYKTMNARLSEEILRNGDNSVFVRVGPGRFLLRRMLEPVVPANEVGVQTLLAPASEVLKKYDAKRRTPASPRERVLVLPREIIEARARYQGIRNVSASRIQRLVTPENARYIERIDAEDTDAYKQIIAYVLVRQGDRLLSFTRGSFNRAASFLRGSRCVGFGGHIAEDDLSIFSTDDMGVRGGVIRELAEEIGLKEFNASTDRLQYRALINDDSSPDGRRHLGIVFEYTAPKSFIARRGEASINQLTWIDLAGGRVDLNQFEYWSQLCLKKLYPDFVRAQADFKIIRRAPFNKGHALVIAGTVGSGKTAVAKQLSDFGYTMISSGNVIATLLGLPPVPETPRQVFQNEAWNFITSRDGPSKLAAAIAAEVLESPDKKFVIDGVRQRATLNALRALLRPRKVAMLYVHTTPDTAIEFYRQREATGISAEDALSQIYGASVEEEVRYFIAESDAVIYNWFGRKDFKKVINQLMRALEKR